MNTCIDLAAASRAKVKCGAVPWLTVGKVISLALGTGSLTTSYAQEALNRSIEANRLIAQSRSQLEGMPYTLRFRELRLLVTPSVGLEWTDNYSLQAATPESDWTIRPGVNFHAFHPIGEASVLSVDVGLFYTKYFDHSTSDRLMVSPGSQIQYEFYVKDFKFDVHERMSYQMDPLLVGGVSGTAEYGGIDNAIGISTAWNLEKFILSLGYDYVLYISKASIYADRSRTSHPVVARGTWKAGPGINIGLESTFEQTIYDTRSFNDTFSQSYGTFADLALSEVITLTPRVGLNQSSFSESEDGSKPDANSSLYYSVQVTHAPFQFLNYSLNFSRGNASGVVSSLSQTTRYGVDTRWNFIRNLPFQVGGFYETSSELAAKVSNDYSRFGVNVGFGFQITSKSSASISYQYVTKSSDLLGQDYSQNRVGLTFNYQF